MEETKKFTENQIMESKLSQSEMSQLKVIEDEVSRFLQGIGIKPENDKGINSALERVINKTLMPSKKIEIIWNDKARRPFIMSITPDISELYARTEKINKLMNQGKNNCQKMVKEWCEITQWFIEIDTRILTVGHRLCVDTGAQFVALLCHEIGHVMNENPMRLFYNYRRKSLEFSILQKLILSNSKALRSIMMPMFTHTLQFMIIVRDRHNARDCELAADAYVPEIYKGELVAYMNDHLLVNPETVNLVIDDDNFNKEQEVGINLSKESIDMLKNRRDVLDRQILNQYNDSNGSKFQKELMKFIGKNLTGYDPEDDGYIVNVRSILNNAYNRETNIMESMAEKLVQEAAKVTDRDLDVLLVQVDTIKTPEDKMYFMHKVYDYIEGVSKELDKKNTKNPKNPIGYKDGRLDKLNRIKEKIISKNVNEYGDRYGVYIKYPIGYEG